MRVAGYGGGNNELQRLSVQHRRRKASRGGAPFAGGRRRGLREGGCRVPCEEVDPVSKLCQEGIIILLKLHISFLLDVWLLLCLLRPSLVPLLHTSRPLAVTYTLEVGALRLRGLWGADRTKRWKQTSWLPSFWACSLRL